LLDFFGEWSPRAWCSGSHRSLRHRNSSQRLFQLFEAIPSVWVELNHPGPWLVHVLRLYVLKTWKAKHPVSVMHSVATLGYSNLGVDGFHPVQISGVFV
jgi:hypothetical protein